MKYCTKMGLCMWRSLYNGRASCVSMEHCLLAVAPENDAQQLKAEIAALASEIERRTRDEVSISPSMVVEKLRQLSAV